MALIQSAPYRTLRLFPVNIPPLDMVVAQHCPTLALTTPQFEDLIIPAGQISYTPYCRPFQVPIQPKYQDAGVKTPTVRLARGIAGVVYTGTV